jgi:hypothetical protein
VGIRDGFSRQIQSQTVRCDDVADWYVHTTYKELPDTVDTVVYNYAQDVVDYFSTNFSHLKLELSDEARVAWDEASQRSAQEMPSLSQILSPPANDGSSSPPPAPADQAQSDGNSSSTPSAPADQAQSVGNSSSTPSAPADQAQPACAWSGHNEYKALQPKVY